MFRVFLFPGIFFFTARARASDVLRSVIPTPRWIGLFSRRPKAMKRAFHAM